MYLLIIVIMPLTIVLLIILTIPAILAILRNRAMP